jgi:hypothetical protein
LVLACRNLHLPECSVLHRSRQDTFSFSSPRHSPTLALSSLQSSICLVANANTDIECQLLRRAWDRTQVPRSLQEKAHVLTNSCAFKELSRLYRGSGSRIDSRPTKANQAAPRKISKKPMEINWRSQEEHAGADRRVGIGERDDASPLVHAVMVGSNHADCD